MASNDIAIIGMSGRYPGGASTPDRLWNVLRDGVDAVTEAKGDRWDLGYFNPDHDQPGRVYTLAGGYLDSVDTFDAEFFGMSPREARQVDPQQRLMLELAWEAFEDAGLVPKAYAGSATGVFVGISSHDYADLIGPGSPDAYSNTGSSLSIAANRVSYVLDLHGPSLAIDTACSSGMVCVHQACRSLLDNACDMAFAGAVNILVNARPWLGFAKASMLSPSGRCKSFDASGDGYVRSEGGGMLLLKRLADAERDGDNILGVIVATGVNSDGRTMGLAMPNKHAQESLLRQVYGASGVKADDVFYVEAHGTGTAVGDPIECEAIGRVLGAPRADGTRLRIGSVKSNIGHLEPASGIAGLTKVLLALKHRELPAQLHYTTPNPKIDFENWKLEVVDRPTPLPDSATPLLFGINSFGFGGTNAHAILREYRSPVSKTTVQAIRPAEPAPQLLMLSGQTETALSDTARDYAAWLRENATENSWTDICATAALCRSTHTHRMTLEASTATEAVARLEAHLAGEKPARLAVGRAAEARKIAFVFSGNGPQWWAMGRELLDGHPKFRAEMAKVDALFQARAGWSVIEELHRTEEESRMALTEVAQPTLFALQVALTAILKESGVLPAAVFGHSVGEVAAAYVSGALDLAQAVDVIYHRSAMQALTAGTGKMAALGISAEETAAAIADIGGFLELAAINAPRAVTVAGEAGALETLRARLTEQGKFARVLALNYPFHSTAMEPIRDGLLSRLAELTPTTAKIPFVSTIAGTTLPGTELDANYWWRNIREPVRFAAAVDHVLRDQGITCFVEIGPHPVLRDYVLQCAKAADVAAVAFPTLRRPAANRPEPELDALALAICTCHAHGAGQPELLFSRPARPAALPVYAWQRVRHWRGKVPLPDLPAPTDRVHPLLGWQPRGTIGLWQGVADTSLTPYLTDHVIQDSILFPAAGYIEMAFAAAGEMLDSDGKGATLDLETFEILRPMVVTTRPIPAIQIAVDPADGTFDIRSRPEVFADSWTTHSRGRLTKADGATAAALNIEALRAALPDRIDGAAHYADARRRGMDYGPAFQGLQEIRMSAAGVSPKVALGEIALPSLEGAGLAGYRAHPAILDCALQALISLIGRDDPRPRAYIPVQVEQIRSFAPLPARVACRLTVTRETDRSGSADIDILAADGSVLLTMIGARFKKVDFRGATATPLVTEAWRADPATPASAAPIALPAPSRIAASLAGDLATLRDSHGNGFATIALAFDAVVGAYAAQAIQALSAPAPFTLQQLQRAGRVPAIRAGLLGRLVAISEADGWLVRDGARWSWAEDRTAPAPATLWRQLLLDHPACSAELVLLARNGERLVEVLRGGTAASDGERIDAATEQLLDGAPYRAVATLFAQTALRAVLAAWPEDRPIRVLELGAGSGGLTAALLPLLPATRTDYVVSDASQAALDRAQQRCAAYPFARTKLFDIAGDLGEQGLSHAVFDLILCGTGLPEAAALTQAQALLAPGGWLVAIDHSAARLDLLLDLARAESQPPAVLQVVADSATDQAQAALREAGFADITRLSDAAEGGKSRQSLLLAQRPIDALVQPAPVHRDASEPSRSWLILAGENATEAAFAADVAACLRGRGQTASVVSLVTYATPADLAPVLDEGADHIVHLAGLEAVADHAPEALLAVQDLRCLSTLNLVNAIKAAELPSKPNLHFVVHGAFAGPANWPLDPSQAPLWGFGRVLANEHPDLAPHMIDLQAALDASSAALLADELLRGDAEVEVLLTAGQRFVNRMQPTPLTAYAAETAARDNLDQAPFRLDMAAQGGIDSLYLKAIERTPPAAGKVELRVHASGLNFRDVLWTMGMLPEEAVEYGFSGATIGMECAGEVVAVGAGVINVAPGDRVVAFASSTFGSHVVTDAGAVSKLPDGIGFAEAATIPTTFLTAYYALDELARLRRGERILIHGAAGGVGLAAIQIAQARGAVVFGTAGSDEKRRVLRLLGVDHVLNSRSLDFADDVMRLTGGQGVDVVLNSLAGEAITKNLQILRPFGRFLEIGKRDFYANSRIGLRPFRNNLSYFGIDADTLLIERADLAQRVFAEVMALFADGTLRPLPFTPLPVTRASEAFRLMQQSRHIGKIVLTMETDAVAPVPAVRAKPRLRKDATYLVTGGLGGFGLATAKWLVEQGAGALALVSRRGVTTDEARDGIAVIEAMGATVRGFAADVANPADVARVMAAIDAEMPPLRGVVHAAVVLDDGPIGKLDGERLRRVFGPKIAGAWNLHEATKNRALDYFVLYSSGTTVVGNPGQANYVAANLYLDALAQYRRSQGLPALAVAWGAIKDVGILARNVGVEEMLQNRTGLGALPASEALIDLGRLMAVDATRASVAQFNIQRLGTLLPGTRTPRFLPMASDSMVATLTAATETLASVIAATPAAERRGVVIARLREHVGRVLGTGAGQIDPARSLSEMGLDSLMAVELAESLEQDVGKPMSVMQLIQAGSVTAICELVMTALDAGEDAAPKLAAE
jgi:acyl transferase domain-containing protein/NADPH:quinone reductase-like Zn-dependent oxidoreductase/SAM-dependent methyltransferase/acyl carrier protein